MLPERTGYQGPRTRTRGGDTEEQQAGSPLTRASTARAADIIPTSCPLSSQQDKRVRGSGSHTQSLLSGGAIPMEETE